MDNSSMSLNPASAVSSAEIDKAAQQLVDLATETNPPIESLLKYQADKHGGNMVGLEFKIKPLSSLVRKMNKMKTPVSKLSDLVDAQYDVLRYTMLIPYERYTEGVSAVLKTLFTQEGCSEFEIKNYWKCMTYRGVNTILWTPSKMKFELQFHTPESFDQKQNKTHILYEALRKESDPVRQNLFFLDMSSMWDNVLVPENIDKIGTSKSQDMPTRKTVSDDDQAIIDRVWKIRDNVKAEIAAVRSRMRLMDPYILSCIEYAGKLYGFQMKEVDLRFKGALRLSRKVEEDVRKSLKLPISKAIQDVQLPSVINGVPFDEYLKKVVHHQTDVLMYKVVSEDTHSYTENVKAFLDLMMRNGYLIKSVDNYWGDMEKHHAISVTFEVVPDHRSVLHPLAAKNATHSGCYFRIEFHTSASYNCLVERRTALSHIEEHMYTTGEAYNKAAADMQVRYDATMVRHWEQVVPPEGALGIGKLRSSISDAPEHGQWHTWLTPAQRRVRKIHTISSLACLTAGIAIGGLIGAKFFAKK